MLHNNWLYSSRRSLYSIIVEICNFLSLLSSGRTQARREHRKNRRKRRKSYPYAFLAQVLGDSGTCYGNVVVTENVVFKARFKRRISVESNSIRKLNATEMFESICIRLCQTWVECSTDCATSAREIRHWVKLRICVVWNSMHKTLMLFQVICLATTTQRRCWQMRPN